MTARVRHDGAWARKALSAPDTRLGRQLAGRSVILAARGVRTPTARFDAQAGEIVFPWIVGTSGREVAFRHRGRDWGTSPTSFLAACLRPLVRLHAVNPVGLDLQPFDPWRLIDRRLPQRGDAVVGRAGATLDAAQKAHRRAKRALAENRRRAAAEQVVAHGDYHVGQLLFTAPMAEPWLLDLDDLAQAPRESDLGNFIAHLSTAKNVSTGHVLEDVEHLTPRLCLLYGALAGTKVDPDLVRAYGTVALLRRALKLRERGADTAFVDDILSAVEGLTDIVTSLTKTSEALGVVRRP